LYLLARLLRRLRFWPWEEGYLFSQLGGVREGKPEISSPLTFDFSFYTPGFTLQRACDRRAAMISFPDLAVGPIDFPIKSQNE
jgi:hypothetical protein